MAVEVGPLERDAAIQLVEHPVPDFPPVYTSAAVDAILALTADQPYLIQVLCSVAVDELNKRHWKPDDPPLSARDVAGLVPKAVGLLESHFLDIWNEQIPAPAKTILRHMARGLPNPLADFADDEDTLNAVLMIERRHIVKERADNMELEVPLFGHYIRTRQSIG